jgi:lipopolysaccharide export system permease protein
MKLYYFYVSKHFLKNFITMLLGITVMFVMINYLTYGTRINGAFNQKISYIFYSWEHSLAILYPLALVFGAIATKVQFIKNNTMGALYSFGYTNKSLILPILFITFFVYALFVFLQTTSFAYAKDEADAFIGTGGKVKASEKIFLKYNDTYAYVDKLDPISKKMYGLSLLKTKDNKIEYTLKSPVAIYSDEAWILKNVTKNVNIYDGDILQRYNIEKYANFKTLDGYKPAIMNTVSDTGGAIKLTDAYETYNLFKSQNIDTKKIRSAVYSKVVTPLFVFGLIIMIFFKMPYLSRYENMTKISSIAIAVSLLIWSSFIGTNFLGSNGVVLPELASFVPIAVLSIFGLKSYFSKELLS